MGAYLCPCFYRRSYTPIRESELEFNDNNKATPGASSGSSNLNPVVENSKNDQMFHAVPDVSDSSRDFDMGNPVFTGMVVHQKFHNKSTYDARFAWINLRSHSLCLSEYNSTDRRHKEASLADINGVVAGPPEKYKQTKGETPNWDQFLTVKFVRGGCIDMKFASKDERDMWYRILLRIISQQQELNQGASAPGSRSQ